MNIIPAIDRIELVQGWVWKFNARELVIEWNLDDVRKDIDSASWCLLHEAGHGIYGSYDIGSIRQYLSLKFKTTVGDNLQDFLSILSHEMLNALEDIRIEKKLIQEFPWWLKYIEKNVENQILPMFDKKIDTTWVHRWVTGVISLRRLSIQELDDWLYGNSSLFRMYTVNFSMLSTMIILKHTEKISWKTWIIDKFIKCDLKNRISDWIKSFIENEFDSYSNVFEQQTIEWMIKEAISCGFMDKIFDLITENDYSKCMDWVFISELRLALSDGDSMRVYQNILKIWQPKSQSWKSDEWKMNKIEWKMVEKNEYNRTKNNMEKVVHEIQEKFDKDIWMKKDTCDSGIYEISKKIKQKFAKQFIHDFWINVSHGHKSWTINSWDLYKARLRKFNIFDRSGRINTWWYDIVFLVDISSSMGRMSSAGSRIQNSMIILNSMIASLRPVRDHFHTSIIAYHDYSHIIKSFDERSLSAVDINSRIEACWTWCTDNISALALAVEMLSWTNSSNKKIIIELTDWESWWNLDSSHFSISWMSVDWDENSFQVRTQTNNELWNWWMKDGDVKKLLLKNNVFKWAKKIKKGIWAEDIHYANHPIVVPWIDLSSCVFIIDNYWMRWLYYANTHMYVQSNESNFAIDILKTIKTLIN